MANWPSSLPEWNLPVTDQAEDGTLRTQMDAGPDKVRRRYSGVPRRFETQITVGGSDRDTLEAFYNTTLSGGAESFTHEDPTTGDTEDFRFLEPPSYEQVAGGDSQSERDWRVTLRIEKLP